MQLILGLADSRHSEHKEAVVEGKTANALFLVHSFASISSVIGERNAFRQKFPGT